jgi:hypothetical protein
MKGDYVEKIAKLFYFCHLKKLIRPETFGPYYVYSLIDYCRFLKEQIAEMHLLVLKRQCSSVRTYLCREQLDVISY